MANSTGPEFIVNQDDLILVTGVSGFIGRVLLESLLDRGCRNIRCLVRPSSDAADVHALSAKFPNARVEVVKGNLLSAPDCAAVVENVAVVYHLATGRDGKSYPDAFMNAVVTTRNLLDATLAGRALRRFVSISSFAVYTNTNKPKGRLLDEACAVESRPELRGDAYCYAKVKQDEIVIEYGRKFNLPYVIVRPGYVLGPQKDGIASRVGIDTFGVFLHLGGSNTIPFTYVDNCVDAIILAGVQPGVDGEIFNVIDDDLPSSRRFLSLYKSRVRRFRSVWVPRMASYALCYAWERYADRSQGQLPPVFNRRHWHAYWKKTRYSNAKAKARLGWTPRVSMADGLERCFASYRDMKSHA